MHGCSNQYGFDICIGTNSGENVSCSADELKKLIDFLSATFLVSVDSIFKASKRETVANYIHQKTGVTCLQMELSNSVRLTPCRLYDFLDCISKMIASIIDAYCVEDGEKIYTYQKRKE